MGVLPSFLFTDLEELEICLVGVEYWTDDDFRISKLTGDFVFRHMPNLKDISVVLPPETKFPSGEPQEN